MRIPRLWSPILAFCLVAACANTRQASQPAMPVSPPPLDLQHLPSGADRQSGAIAAGTSPAPTVAYGAVPAVAAGAASPGAGPGDISFDFAGTDLRTAVAQILGNILHVNYTIDPAVSGTVTLHTVTPLNLAQVLPVLQTLLAENKATLVETGALYRVMPAETGGSGLAGNAGLSGAEILPLRYASATDLAAMLQPYVAEGASLAVEPGANALLIQGDPGAREALSGLVEAFDVDALAGQSYELFPVGSGNAKEFADAFTEALGKHGETKGPAAVSVVPLERISAVLVIARSAGYLRDATRVYSVLEQIQRETLRSWHVFYLRNSRANDAAYLLQQAFTPDDVSAQPTEAAQPGSNNGMTGNTDNGAGAGGLLGSAVVQSGTTPQAGSASAMPALGGQAQGGAAGAGATAGASALLGPLSANSGGTSSASALRILPDIQNNAVLVYATVQEDDAITGMLSKIDIQPLQVRIDATIAEVDLTGQLQYGTQFFFKSGGINAVLSNSASSALATNFPGFVLSGHGNDAAPLALSALQAVTRVRVLSSPELMVLDGQGASLQVGNIVPYLTQTSQSTITANAEVINSVDYRETGVILRVTPHVGSDGLVTMDIDQEVSGVSPTLTTQGLNSPTFTERAVTSRVAIQDGQTIGLAGLISDNDSRENGGFPGLKDIPLLGGLFGTQNNNRTREELLVLITPHVIRSQQQALDLTADMQQALPNAMQVTGALQGMPIGGSADPDEAFRARVGQ